MVACLLTETITSFDHSAYPGHQAAFSRDALLTLNREGSGVDILKKGLSHPYPVVAFCKVSSKKKELNRSIVLKLYFFVKRFRAVLNK